MRQLLDVIFLYVSSILVLAKACHWRIVLCTGRQHFGYLLRNCLQELDVARRCLLSSVSSFDRTATEASSIETDNQRGLLLPFFKFAFSKPCCQSLSTYRMLHTLYDTHNEDAFAVSRVSSVLIFLCFRVSASSLWPTASSSSGVPFSLVSRSRYSLFFPMEGRNTSPKVWKTHPCRVTKYHTTLHNMVSCSYDDTAMGKNEGWQSHVHSEAEHYKEHYTAVCTELNNTKVHPVQVMEHAKSHQRRLPKPWEDKKWCSIPCIPHSSPLRSDGRDTSILRPIQAMRRKRPPRRLRRRAGRDYHGKKAGKGVRTIF